MKVSILPLEITLHSIQVGKTIMLIFPDSKVKA